MTMPKKATAAISGKLNFRMTGLATGMSSASTVAPMMPPMAETA